MRTLATVVFTFIFVQSLCLAQTIPQNKIEDVEILESSTEKEPTVTIKEVKDLLTTLSKEETCLDEYMKRRTQLITKLSFIPVTATLTVAGSIYAGGTIAAGATSLANMEAWGALGYVVLGVGAGAVVSSIYVIYDTTKTTLDTIDNNLVIKVLAEQYLGRPGEKSDKFYQNYLKNRPKNPLSKEELLEKFMEQDKEGSLCDGSLVKQPKYKIGFKLKYKVAKAKDFYKSL